MLIRLLSLFAVIATALAMVPTPAGAAPFEQDCNDAGECWTVKVLGDQE